MLRQESTNGPSRYDNNLTREASHWLRDGLRWRWRVLLQGLTNVKLRSEARFRNLVGVKEPETKLVKDSQNYWNDHSIRNHGQNSHWRGVGIFADDSRWLALGPENLELYEEFARLAKPPSRLKSIVEWGCGGGVNAVHFGRLAEKFYGVDICGTSLAECARQMRVEALDNFTPGLIDAEHPESAIE